MDKRVKHDFFLESSDFFGIEFELLARISFICWRITFAKELFIGFELHRWQSDEQILTFISDEFCIGMALKILWCFIYQIKFLIL